MKNNTPPLFSHFPLSSRWFTVLEFDPKLYNQKSFINLKHKSQIGATIRLTIASRDRRILKVYSSIGLINQERRTQKMCWNRITISIFINSTNSTTATIITSIPLFFLPRTRKVPTKNSFSNSYLIRILCLCQISKVFFV